MGDIYPGLYLPPKAGWEAYTRVYTSLLRLDGRFIPGLYLSPRYNGGLYPGLYLSPKGVPQGVIHRYSSFLRVYLRVLFTVIPSP